MGSSTGSSIDLTPNEALEVLTYRGLRRDTDTTLMHPHSLMILRDIFVLRLDIYVCKTNVGVKRGASASGCE